MIAEMADFLKPFRLFDIKINDWAMKVNKIFSAVL